MLDWIFEGIVTWVSSIASELMDAVSRVFLDALGTDMDAMEGYFPFVTKAFEVMQYMAWAVLFLITVWQLFRVFGGPITEAENPWQLLLRSALFALLVGAARPIFTMALDIARAPYTALMEVSMEEEDFTFAGIEEALKNGLTTIVSTVSVVGPILILVLLITLGWNYFKLLLECVERYIVVGVLCYTSPLAFAMGGGAKSAGSVFRSGGSAASSAATGAGAAASSFSAGFASKFKGNSYVRDAVVEGGSRMGLGGSVGFVGQAFGGIAARNGAVLTGESISSVASRPESVSGAIAGDIADRSLQNYMPQLTNYSLAGTQITGGHIHTVATRKAVEPGPEGSPAEGAAWDQLQSPAQVDYYSASQYEAPEGPYSLVTAADGSAWYQVAAGEGSAAFYDLPEFSGSALEESQVRETFPGVDEGTTLRTVEQGVLEATGENGSALWYNSAFYEEPDAPHSVTQSANGVSWYQMEPPAQAPDFETGEQALAYNRASFQNFMPGFEQQVTTVDGSHREEGRFEVRHTDGSGTQFFDTTRYAAPRGDYKVYEGAKGQQWYAIHGEPAVERKPVYLDGKAVYEDGKLKTTNVETVRYKAAPRPLSETPAPAGETSQAPAEEGKVIPHGRA